MNSDTVKHELAPVYDAGSRVLILGTMPSPKSRERGFYYMHPQNRFWKMLCAVLEKPVPESIEGRRELCLANKIALWDVLASCEISGASDASIKNGVPNRLDEVFSAADIKAVFTTGKTAYNLFRRFFPNDTHELISLPSTSPANRTITEAEMLERYRKIAEYL